MPSRPTTTPTGFSLVDVGNSNSLGNAYADLLTGTLNGYQETNFNRINDISYNTYEGFVQDSWKVTPPVDPGTRIARHALPALDRPGGLRIFHLRLFEVQLQLARRCSTAVSNGTRRTRRFRSVGSPRGLCSGSRVLASRTISAAKARPCFAADGAATTTIRASSPAGWTCPPEWSRVISATMSTAYPLLARNLDTLNVADQASSPAAVDSKDDRQPYTDSYSFTVSQRLPWSSLLEVAYVGNQSKDLQITGGAGSNINLVPVGAMLSSRNGGVDPNSLTADNFRPLKGFSDLPLATNGAYANYNALQVTWVRQKGRYTINMNYTHGKAMGIVNNPQLDQFNLNNNYGVQPANRKHIFNAAYSIELGNPVQGQDRRRLPQRLAALRHHATAKRRQPLGFQHQQQRQLRHEPQRRQDPGDRHSISATCRCWGRTISSSAPC